MKAKRMLRDLGFERCPECHCAVGDDWNFKDFSNETIVVCPQCKTDIYIEEIE